MDIARVVSDRSTCLRRQVGAVIVRDKRILATGYNGAPAGLAHCSEVGCLREERGVAPGERHELCRGLHAEQNTLLQAALYGIAVSGATLYSTHRPCALCAKMLINSGVRDIHYGSGYPDELAEVLLAEAGVRLVKQVGGNK
ncbi:MAG: cytidine/deoxycytidylate deaminase family protein [Chloroflexi bacterium]|nr:cytidine/deoxycytidylate deaminase family protein [Chloroflexota bacterium]